MGGEKNKELEGVWLPMGSPPRRRGKVVHCAAVRALRGITPRVGGEKPFLFCGGSSDSGSPPHRRGKVRRIRENLERVGITPAWAGKSWQSGNRLCFTWDHPRMGGEKLTSGVFSSAEDGSPPHGRGKELFNLLHVLRHRITPAQAGKSKLALCTPSCPTDHPCAGGEKNKELEGVWLPMGSPPRGRGKDLTDTRHLRGLRITPAWAGKSKIANPFIRAHQDHPRVGGEKGCAELVKLGLRGSPPRGRGKD